MKKAIAEPTYKIIRFYRDDDHPDNKKVIKRGLTLEEVQAHCNDPATSERDDIGVVWFDGYDEDEPHFDLEAFHNVYDGGNRIAAKEEQ